MDVRVSFGREEMVAPEKVGCAVLVEGARVELALEEVDGVRARLSKDCIALWGFQRFGLAEVGEWALAGGATLTGCTLSGGACGRDGAWVGGWEVAGEVCIHGLANAASAALRSASRCL